VYITNSEAIKIVSSLLKVFVYVYNIACHVTTVHTCNGYYGNCMVSMVTRWMRLLLIAH